MNTAEQQEIQKFLSRGDWFGSLPPDLQELIVSRSLVRKFAKGQIIYLEESLPKGLYAVLDGNVHLVREVSTGAEALIHVGEPGFWFCDYGALTGRPTVVTVLAHSPVRVLQLPKAQLDGILADEPRYFRDFAQLVFERYATLARILVEVQGVAPEARLRSRLATMAQLQLRDRPQSAPAVSLAVSQADLARIVGVSRQTLNALLGKLDREGLIEVGFRRIRVLDLPRLAGAREDLESRATPRSTALPRGAPPAPGASSERFE